MALPLFFTERGEPERLRAETRDLRVRTGMLRQVAEMLDAVSTKGVWDSGAGVAFAGEVGQCPQTLRQVADRLEEAAHVVGPYADALAEAQQRMSVHRDAYERYSEESDRLEVRLGGMSPQDPDYARVDRQWRDAANEREFAKQRYHREGEQATRDEEVAARRLDAVADVGADPAVYDVFEGLRDLGTSQAVSVTGIVAKPVATLALADPIGRLGHKLVYDEGSYAAIGDATTRALLSVVKLPKGIGASADDAARKADRAKHVTAAKARHAASPPAGGTRAARLRESVRAKARQTTAGATVRGRHAAQDGFETVTGIRLITNMTSDWKAIAGAGHVAKGVHITKYTAASVKAVDSTIGMAQTSGCALRSARRQKSVAPPSEECKR